MARLNHSYVDNLKEFRVCPHLLEAEEIEEYYQYFTGVGLDYVLVCSTCAKQPAIETLTLLEVDKSTFEKIVSDGYIDGITGRPQINFEPTSLAFEHRFVTFTEFKTDPLLIVQPLAPAAESLWIGVTASGTLVRIDCDGSAVEVISHLLPEELELSQPLELVLSQEGRWAAVANLLKVQGVVIELDSGRHTMNFSRTDYHAGVSPFPLAFVIHEGRSLLIHGTAWNRLDVSDPATGELLTAREYGPCPSERSYPEHYLDYFHGRLSVSPDQTWIVDDGWVWHPVGVMTAWSLPRWLRENIWESEDGPSRKDLECIDYFWNVPFCWIDHDTVAVWGYGDDDICMIPAARLIEVPTGTLKYWFAGPEIAPPEDLKWPEKMAHPGAFFFDRYLFSVSERYGISVWDVNRGVGLLQDPSFAPGAYHPQTREFLTLLPDGRLQLSRLIGF